MHKTAAIITSTYNGAGYLSALLDSLLAQTYPHIDFYVRDDGSSDQTYRILKEYQPRFQNGKRMILLNEADHNFSNMGAHESYRYLFSQIKEAFCYMICDQDDVWDPRKIERAVHALSTYPSDTPVLYVHNYYLCDGDLNIQKKLPDRTSITPAEMAKVNLAKVIMTGTWASVGMAQVFNHRLKELAYDMGEITPSVATDCFISWVAAGFNGAVLYDNEPLAYYRRHDGTYSSGDASGLRRYQDWMRHMNRHCDNIKNGIADYRRLYRSFLSPDRQAILDLFSSKKRIRKFFYPHRLRTSLIEELAFRILILFGKI